MQNEDCPLLKEKPSRADSTIDFYLKRCEKLKIKCAKLLNMPIEEITSLELASYLHDNAINLSRATVRLYKAMLYFYFDSFPDEFVEQAFAIVKSIPVIKSPKKTLKTSGMRGKNMSENTFASVIYALSLSDYRGKYNHLTSMWLQAGALTGLRPHEWQHAELVFINGDLMLKVKNGKTTNSRSHGEFRHLNLSDISDNEKQIIEQFLRMINPYCYSNEDFKKIYTACMETLRVLNRRLEKGGYFTKEQGFTGGKGSGVYFRSNLGKRVQLYTGRHRFCSVMKRVAELSEIAAMMGHKTNRTVSVHYGKTDKKTIKTKRPKPVSEELAKVEQKYNRINKSNNVKNIDSTISSNLKI